MQSENGPPSNYLMDRLTSPEMLRASVVEARSILVAYYEQGSNFSLALSLT